MTERTATDGDAWSGFGSKSASLMPSAGDPATPSAGTGGELALGAGLLALGLLGLGGGIAYAQVSRRRATARGTSRS